MEGFRFDIYKVLHLMYATPYVGLWLRFAAIRVKSHCYLNRPRFHCVTVARCLCIYVSERRSRVTVIKTKSSLKQLMQNSLKCFQIVKQLYFFWGVGGWGGARARGINHNILSKFLMLRIWRKRQGHENHYYHNHICTFTPRWFTVKFSWTHQRIIISVTAHYEKPCIW